MIYDETAPADISCGGMNHRERQRGGNRRINRISTAR
jgi:hypothetical protein